MRRHASFAALVTLSLWACGTFLPGWVPPRAPSRPPWAGSMCGCSSACAAKMDCRAMTTREALKCGCCSHRSAIALPGAAQVYVLPIASPVALPLPATSVACARSHRLQAGPGSPEAPPPRA